MVSATTEISNTVLSSWTGDYSQMVKRRVIRFLVPYSKTFYFFDGITPKGLSYETIIQFEKELNKKLKTRHLKIHALVVPTPRDQLIPRLISGHGDIVVANLTITESRLAKIVFSDPMLTGIDELLVGGPGSPAVKNLFDLSGKSVMVCKSASYYDSLRNVNKVLRSNGQRPIAIIPANENLEDEDILEMVTAGLVPLTVVDSHKARFWAKILPNLKLYEQIKLRSGGRIGWGFRKNSPELKGLLTDLWQPTRKALLWATFYSIVISKTRNISLTQYMERR